MIPSPTQPAPHSHLLAHAAERLWSALARETSRDVFAAIETAYDRAVDAIVGGCSDADIYEAWEAARLARLEHGATYWQASWALAEVEDRLESLESPDDVDDVAADDEEPADFLAARCDCAEGMGFRYSHDRECDVVRARQAERRVA